MKHTYIMRTFKYLAAMLLMALATSCGPKTTDTEEVGGCVSRRIDITEFIAVQSEIASDVLYREIPSGRQVVVSAPKQLIDKIKVHVDNGILIISYKDRTYKPADEEIDNVTVNVSGSLAHAFYANCDGDILILDDVARPNQRMEIVTSGNGDVKATGMISCKELVMESSNYGDAVVENVKADKVTIKSTGAGDIRAKGLTCHEVEAQALESGDVTVRGTAGVADLKAENHGDVFAQKLEAHAVTAQADGDCMIICFPIDKLTAETSGKGKIVLDNEPLQKHYAPNAKITVRSEISEIGKKKKNSHNDGLAKR